MPPGLSLVAGHRLLLLQSMGLGHTDSIVAANGLSCPSACGIFVSQQVIKPASPALEGRFLTTGQPGKSHWSLGFKNLLGYDDSEIYNCRSDLSLRLRLGYPPT